MLRTANTQRPRYLALIIALGLFVVPFDVNAQESTLYSEDFDGLAVPDLPAGWFSEPAGAWASSSSVAGPASGANNLVVSGGDSGSVHAPIMDFTQTVSARLVYNARRTSTFATNTLIVEASIDGGTTFPIVVADTNAAVGSATSSYEEISMNLPPALVGASSVQFRWRSLGNAGGNCRVDDVRILGTGSVATSTLGFAQPTTNVATGDTALVDVDLSLLPAIGSLHGLQFDLSWSDSISAFAVQRGSAVANTADWELAVRLDSLPGRVVLLSRTASGLPAGDYSALLRIAVASQSVGSGRTDTLAIRAILGSQSVDTGDDASLAASNLIHTISTAEPFASFGVDPDSLDFGLLAPDTLAFDSVTVTNDVGNTPLSGTVSSDHPAVDVVPASYTVQPGDSLVFIVYFDAAVSGPGSVTGHLEFNHNGDTSPDTVTVSARVGAASTRGDVNDDGLTDIVDLVIAIDHVVGGIQISPEFVGRIDLHPFPEGDGSVDIRDLTVLVKAINQGIWPDGQLVTGLISAAKTGQNGPASILIQSSGEQTSLTVTSEIGLRAIQLVLTRSGGLDPGDLLTASSSEFVRMRTDEYVPFGPGFVSILAYSFDGPLSAKTDFEVATMLGLGETPKDSLSVVYALGVDLSNTRITLGVTSTLPEGPFPVLSEPFPNPFSISRDRGVNIPVSSGGPTEVEVSVTDVLGRLVHRDRVRVSRTRPLQWNVGASKGPVAPGLYFVSISSQTDRQTVPVVIAR